METSKCKSCQSSINSSDKYCQNCGGKVINERLTLKSIWQEFVGPFFSWDNNFNTTTKALVTKPDDVLLAFVSGARKKYFKPFPFLILYSTISLLFYKLFPVEMFQSFEKGLEYGASQHTDDVQNILNSKELTSQFSATFYNYYNFIIVLSVPIVALTSFLTFKKYRHNYSEHLIFQSYIQSFIGYLSMLINIIAITMLNMELITVSSITILLTLIYLNWVFYKMYKYNFGKLIVNNLKAIAIFMVLCFILISTISIIVSLVVIQNL